MYIPGVDLQSGLLSSGLWWLIHSFCFMSNSRNNSLLLFYLWPSGVSIIGFFFFFFFKHRDRDILPQLCSFITTALSFYSEPNNSTIKRCVILDRVPWLQKQKRCVFSNTAASVSCVTYNICSKAITTIYCHSYMVVKMTFAQWVSHTHTAILI